MDSNISMQFDKLFNIKMEEIFGSCSIAIEPGSFCVFDENTPSNSLHYHNCFEICLVTGGSGEFIHGDETYIIREADVFIANPGVKHEIRLLPGSSSKYAKNLYLVFFRMNIFENSGIQSHLYEERMLRQFLLSHAILRRSQKQLFSYLYFINSYIGASMNENYGLYQVVKTMALDSVFSLVNVQDSEYRKQIPSITIVDQAIGYIGVNLDRRIFLKEIAGSACTSERNLQYLFQKHLRKSVTDYINERKTAVAAGYLKMNFEVGDVCNLIGINDIAQFSRLFKKYYGMPPKKYQRTYSPGGMISGVSY